MLNTENTYTLLRLLGLVSDQSYPLVKRVCVGFLLIGPSALLALPIMMIDIGPEIFLSLAGLTVELVNTHITVICKRKNWGCFGYTMIVSWFYITIFVSVVLYVLIIKMENRERSSGN